MDTRDKRNGHADEGAPTDEGRVTTASDEAGSEPTAEADADFASAPSEADLLRERLTQLEGRLRLVSKAYSDLQAEMKAYRERSDAQLKINKERQAFEVVRNFFDPVMNLKRSIASHGDDMQVLLEGLQMVLHQFMSALEQLGLEKVPGEGAPFDPHLHEALAVAPVEDSAQDGRVLLVHADGWSVNGKVLQPAQVVIGKYETPSGEA